MLSVVTQPLHKLNLHTDNFMQVKTDTDTIYCISLSLFYNLVPGRCHGSLGASQQSSYNGAWFVLY